MTATATLLSQPETFLNPTLKASDLTYHLEALPLIAIETAWISLYDAPAKTSYPRKLHEQLATQKTNIERKRPQTNGASTRTTI